MLLLAACYLQRIELLGSSLGFFVIASLFTLAIVRSVRSGRLQIQRSVIMYSYPIFIFAFTFPPFITTNNMTFDSYTPFIAPLIVWAYLMLQESPPAEDFTYGPTIWTILLLLGYTLASDFISMFSAGDQSLKKNFEFSNPNFTGFLINILTSFFLYGTKRIKLQTWAFLLVSSAFIILTLSKTAYILQALTILLYFNKQLFKAMIVIIPMMLFFGAAITSQIDALSRIQTFFENDTAGAVSHRLGLIKSAWNIFCDNPIFGIGYGNYQKYAFFIYDAPFAVKTHNIILTILSERGLFGLSLLGISQLIIWVSMKSAWTKGLIFIYVTYWLYSLTHAIGETLVIWPIIIYLISKHHQSRSFLYSVSQAQNHHSQSHKIPQE